MGRMLGYGNIEILTASELGVNKFTYIGRPIQYKTAMLNARKSWNTPRRSLRPRSCAGRPGRPSHPAGYTAPARSTDRGRVPG